MNKILPGIGTGAKTSQYAMGTVMTHEAFGSNARKSLSAVCGEVSRMEGLLSRFIPGSDISRVNESAGLRSETVCNETYDVLSKTAEFLQDFSNYFDLTIGPLVALWQMAKKSCSQPAAASIRQALSLVNNQDLILDSRQTTVGLKNIGQSVDPGGIGKGFVADKILDVFRRFGISSAYSNLGGNVVTVGAKPDSRPWQIGIQHPREERSIIGRVSVVNQTVVTSGDYQRCFSDRQGRIYHHILNPKTGYPADSGLISISVISNSSFTADSLSTILFVAGIDKGLTILSNYPQTEAIFVDKYQNVFITSGLRHRFQAADGIDVKILDPKE